MRLAAVMQGTNGLVEWLW